MSYNGGHENRSTLAVRLFDGARTRDLRQERAEGAARRWRVVRDAWRARGKYGLALVLALAIAPLGAQTTIAWTKVTNPAFSPGFDGYLNLQYNPLNRCILHYGVPSGSTSIYSSTFYCYDPRSNTWGRINGYDVAGNTCTYDAPTQPGDRHPVEGMAFDTLRNRLWLSGGVNATCATGAGDQIVVDTAGTTVTWVCCGSRQFHSSWDGAQIRINGVNYTIESVESATSLTLSSTAGTQNDVDAWLTDEATTKKLDLYYLSLNSNILASAWTRVDAATPKSASDGKVYIPSHDVILSYGHSATEANRMLIYCPTSGGGLSAAQTEAGCTVENDWRVLGGITGSPTAYSWTRLIYIGNGQAFLYGGQAGATPQNETWIYNVATLTWTEKCTSGCTPPPAWADPSVPGAATPVPATAYNSLTGKVLYHQTNGTGSPQTWEFDPAGGSTGTWTVLSTTGDGPGPVDAYAVFDPERNVMMLWSYPGPDVWIGQLNNTPTVTGQFRILGTWPSGNAKWIEVCGLVDVSAGSTASVTLTGLASGSKTLTIQETLYPGSTSGVARDDEPFCMGVPVADSDGLTSVSGLALTGTVAVPNAMLATDLGTKIGVGTGVMNFEIRKANTNILDVVRTPGDSAVTIVPTSTSEGRGLVLIGPDPTATYPADVTCSPDTGGSTCNVLYSSSNDASSTCSIEANGPVYAVVKCIGTHKTSGGEPYMQFTTRTRFWYGKSNVKLHAVLRNANYTTGSSPSPDRVATFMNAAKGIRSYEFRIGANLSGTLDWTIANETGTPLTGTMNATTDDVFVYQGQATHLQDATEHAVGSARFDLWTEDLGWNASKNAASQDSGDETQVIGGWADLSNSSNVGIQIGLDQMSSRGPASLEFIDGVSVRIGFLSAQNTKNAVYLPWPEWLAFAPAHLNFHISAPASLANDFLRFQHPLVGRADPTHYNATGVFQYNMPTATQESDFYTSLDGSLSPAIDQDQFWPVADFGSSNALLRAYRFFNWGAGGGPSLQGDHRKSRIEAFFRRGTAGGYLDAEFFYRYAAGRAWPHSDGATASDSSLNTFLWSSRLPNTSGTPEIDNTGPNPKPDTKQNEALAVPQNWVLPDYNHATWTGITDFYFLTGDEYYKEALVSLKAHFLATVTYQGCSFGGTPATCAGGLATTRAVGFNLLNSATFAEYLRSVGDADWDEILANGTLNFEQHVKPVPCVNGLPTGCSESASGYYFPGIGRERGMHVSTGGAGQGWCSDDAGFYRGNAVFLYARLIEGIDKLRRVKGTGWADYNLAGDLAYGLAQFVVTEMFTDRGDAVWFGDNDGTDALNSGFANGIVFDRAQTCDGEPGSSNSHGLFHTINGHKWDQYTMMIAHQNMWRAWLPIYQTIGSLSASEQRKIKIALHWVADANPNASAINFGGDQIGNLIHAVNAAGPVLTEVIPTVGDNMDGTYDLEWTPPAGATGSYTIKYSAKTVLAPSATLQFESRLANTFGVDPDSNIAWFAATRATETPTCTATCTVMVDTSGLMGLTADNFSVSVMASQQSTRRMGGVRFGGVRVQ